MPPGVTLRRKLTHPGWSSCLPADLLLGEPGGGCYPAGPSRLAEQRPSLKGKEQSEQRRNVLASDLRLKCFTFHRPWARSRGRVEGEHVCAESRRLAPALLTHAGGAPRLIFGHLGPSCLCHEGISFPKDWLVPKGAFAKDH